jgi:hypothetical protein
MSRSESPKVEGGLNARGRLRAKSRHPFVSASISKADISIGVLGDGDEWIRIVRFRAGTSRIRRCGLGTREQHLRAGPEKYEDLAVPVMDGRKGGHAELAF